MKKVFVFALIVSLFLSGCTAAVQLPSNYAPPLVEDVVHIATGTVLNGIKACLNMACGAEILAKGNNYLFVWTFRDTATAGFAGITRTGIPVDLSEAVRTGGNLVNSRTIKEVIDSLQANGWTKLHPGEVPIILTATGYRLVTAPVLVISTEMFDGDFEKWMEDTFGAVESQS